MRDPVPAPLTPAALVRFVVISAVALLLAHLVDPWAYVHWAVPELAKSDLGRMLRVMGFLPVWIIGALALVLCDWPVHRAQSLYAARARGSLLLGGAVAGGAAAEILKLVFRRERPWSHGGEYAFRDWSERTFSTGGLALPSSHALVAFGALFMLAKLFPRARWVWWGLGAGCAFSRVAAGAHFVSDVVLSAVVGAVVVEILWSAHQRRMARELRVEEADPVVSAPLPARESIAV